MPGKGAGVDAETGDGLGDVGLFPGVGLSVREEGRPEKGEGCCLPGLAEDGLFLDKSLNVLTLLSPAL